MLKQKSQVTSAVVEPTVGTICGIDGTAQGDQAWRCIEIDTFSSLESSL